MTPFATCQYCGWTGPADRCAPLENAWERVQPGDPMPAGECPECSASAMLDEKRHDPAIRIETTLVPEFATVFDRQTAAQAVADIMASRQDRWSCRPRMLDASSWRIEVHARNRPLLASLKGYLRIVDL